MKKLAYAVALMATALWSSLSLACDSEVLDVSAKRLLGESVDLCDAYAGKVLLVVNTASQCGYVGQLGGLQALQQRYGAQGFSVLGFPSADFGGQEFDSAEKTAEFCKINYGVEFPMFEKGAVKAAEAQPLFAKLYAAGAPQPRWNYHKYLVGRDGRFLTDFDTRIEPEDERVRSAIEAALQQ
ncbi:glutathione peroxidase [Algiphilus sp.]|uniref:glutathione peroxidase n=1 Tax=Algiphilus sp. TaxID=1872431 RepID=UPI003B518C08